MFGKTDAGSCSFAHLPTIQPCPNLFKHGCLGGLRISFDDASVGRLTYRVVGLAWLCACRSIFKLAATDQHGAQKPGKYSAFNMLQLGVNAVLA